jgi:hypothetical protein
LGRVGIAAEPELGFVELGAAEARGPEQISFLSNEALIRSGKGDDGLALGFQPPNCSAGARFRPSASIT